MKIVICASIQFTPEIIKIADQLKDQGHKVILPDSTERIIRGEFTLEEFLAKVEKGEGSDNKIKYGVIKKYFFIIKENDAILVLNYAKKGIENYIGGNTFLEMGFAHVLDKKTFLLNPIPDMPYKDELIAFQPTILNNDLTLIK